MHHIQISSISLPLFIQLQHNHETAHYCESKSFKTLFFSFFQRPTQHMQWKVTRWHQGWLRITARSSKQLSDILFENLKKKINGKSHYRVCLKLMMIHKWTIDIVSSSIKRKVKLQLRERNQNRDDFEKKDFFK